MCDDSLLPVLSSIPSTLAALIPFNNTDEDPQIVSQLREFHDFPLFSESTNQSIKSVCPEKQRIQSNRSSSETNNLTLSGVEPKTFPFPNLPLVMETVPIRADSVPYGTVSNAVRPSTIQYGTIPDENHFELISTVQSGTNSNKTSVPLTVPFNTTPVPLTVPLAFVQGLKPSKRNDSRFKNIYSKQKKLARTPLLVPRIIKHSKRA